jgi:hypothetical protein
MTMAARGKRSSGRTERATTRERDVAGLDAQARLAVNLPAGTHRRLKARAAEEGSSIRDYILAMLKKNGI